MCVQSFSAAFAKCLWPLVFLIFALCFVKMLFDADLAVEELVVSVMQIMLAVK